MDRPLQWAATFDDVNIGLACVDRAGCVFDCNRAYTQILGLSRDELLGRVAAEGVHDPGAEDELFRALAEGSIAHYQLEQRHVGRDGRLVWTRLTVAADRDASGELCQAYRMVEDITDRKRAEERTAAQHAVARILAESATLDGVAKRILQAVCASLRWDLGGLWEVDRKAQLLRFVDIWHDPTIDVGDFVELTRRLTIGAGSGLPGRAWEKGQPVWHDDVPRAQNFPRAAVAARVGLHGAFAFPIVIGGEVVGVMDFFSREIREPDADVLQMFATVGSQLGQFIERKRAEEDVRALAAELSAAEDAERRRLAGDIHDSIGQTLSVVKMELEAAAHEAKKSGEPPPALLHSLGLLDAVIAQTRSLIFDLYPAMLDDLGLVPTLCRYAEQMGQFQVTVSEAGTRKTIPAAVTNYMFRATKELLTNAAKHARAHKVIVTVRWARQGLRIMVADDGCGFDPTEALAPQNRRGLGLADIRERIRSLGGQLHIESAPGQGTQVILEVPLGEQPGAQQRSGTAWR
jgi:PAS domain S-box-containing protein